LRAFGRAFLFPGVVSRQDQRCVPDAVQRERTKIGSGRSVDGGRE
jgi:hypothetical protein